MTGMMPGAVLVLLASGITPVMAQDGTTFQDTLIIFGTFTVAVIALFLYLARDILLRRRTQYDKDSMESKQNRDYEKYHSDWLDDYNEYRKENPDLNDQDHYAVLDVPTDATLDMIKQQYRRLAKEHHPDKTGQESQEMRQINLAYEVLSDRERREIYDNARGEI